VSIEIGHDLLLSNVLSLMILSILEMIIILFLLLIIDRAINDGSLIWVPISV
jgi:hypothetical protein